MCTKSPTCILSGPSCIQTPQRVSTISSEVESNSAFFCERCPYLQDQSTMPMGNHSRCCPVTGILPAITRSHDIEEGDSSHTESQHSRTQHPPTSSAPQAGKSPKSNRSSGWKTSKFFSKTMSSGEILRGLKKLSLTSSGSSSDPGEPEPGKPRKSKSGQLKKRSSCGNDDGVTLDDENKARSPRSPGGFRPLSKAMSLSEPGSTSKTSSLGIVCKKEDLKAILCTATSKRFPLASPTKRRRGQAPLRQTKSASFDPPDDRSSRKEPVRRAGSEESRTRRNNQSFDNEIQLQKDIPSNKQEQQVLTSSAIVVDDMNAQNNHLSGMADDHHLGHLDSVGEGSISAVKWDESEVVDAVLIGDAIESFLKGSMSGSEKRVSFRKNSDRKVKSDG